MPPRAAAEHHRGGDVEVEPPRRRVRVLVFESGDDLVHFLGREPGRQALAQAGVVEIEQLGPRSVPISMLISVAVEPIINGTSAEISGADGQLGPAGRTLPSATGRHTARSLACAALLMPSISAFHRQVEQLAGVRQAERCKQRLCVFGRRVGRHRLQMRVARVGAALDDRAMEQALAGRHRHHGRDLSAAAGLAEDRHVARVAAELADIVAHPFERRDEIEHAGVGSVRKLRQQLAEIKEAERIQPMVNRHHDHVAAPRQPRAVEHAAGAGEGGEIAAVEPDHHRALAAVAQAGRPDVQSETVLADGRRIGP